MASSDLTALMVSDALAERPGGTSEYPSCVPPEPAEGNVEYKLKLLEPSPSRFVHLVTQMKWRLREGQGEAIYEIGVEDKGTLAGLSEADLKSSLNTLQRMAEHLGASTTILRQCAVEGIESTGKKHYVAEVLVRRVPDDHQVLPLRVAVLGSEAAGKSTLLGVLTRGEFDNGRGSARLNLLRHRHEVASGHTSSVSHEILGFDSGGKVVNYIAQTAEDFCERAAKLISFVDLAGHQKYQKTTVCGLTCSQPDFVLLVVSAVQGIVGMTREHLALTMALHVPLFVVVTKVDACTEAVCQRTIQQIARLLRLPGCNRSTLQVTSEQDAVHAATGFTTGRLTPIFPVSCVTGDNLDLLKHFLNLLPTQLTLDEQKKLEQEHAEFQVEETYQLSGVGTVVGGILVRGIVRVGDEVFLGPDEHGDFRRVLVASLQRNRLPCRMLRAGQVATLALPGVERVGIRRGSVLTSKSMGPPMACLEFEANIYPLSQPEGIQCNRQVTVHLGAIMQNVIITRMNSDRLTMGKCCCVRFRFVHQFEFVCVGRRLFFRAGRCKGMGEVTRVMDNSPNTPVGGQYMRRHRMVSC